MTSSSIGRWLDDERTLVAGKRGATRLGFALLLKFYTRHGRFPARAPDVRLVNAKEAMRCGQREVVRRDPQRDLLMHTVGPALIIV